MNFKLDKILSYLMKRKKLSVSELARKTEVNAQTLHNWLSGQKPRNITHIKRVADFFDVSIEYLCFGEPDHLETSILGREGVFKVTVKRWES